MVITATDNKKCTLFYTLGDCPECKEVISQPCRCGKSVKEQPCSLPEWSCQQVCMLVECFTLPSSLLAQVCGALLSCGHHCCQKVCHGGECGRCPNDGERTCPCGKKSKRLHVQEMIAVSTVFVCRLYRSCLGLY